MNLLVRRELSQSHLVYGFYIPSVGTWMRRSGSERGNYLLEVTQLSPGRARPGFPRAP